MTVFRESPWYQEILQKGEARGEARDEAKGVERVAQNLLQMQIPAAELWR